MGRCIDEDSVMKMLTSVELNNGTITNAKIELRNCRTAFDIEKTIAELEASAEGAKDSKDLSKYTAYKKSIEIIKANTMLM